MNVNNLPYRKNLRLKNYDYSKNGCYFVTVCVLEKRQNLCHAKNKSNIRVGAGLCARPGSILVLTQLGKEVEKSIRYIDEKYNKQVIIENYCIMPNHIHLLLKIDNSKNADGHRGPSLRDVIRNLKSYTTNRYEKITGNVKSLLWQKGYYDHIIRNDEDYAEKYQYITNNPLKWLNDGHCVDMET